MLRSTLFLLAVVSLSSNARGGDVDPTLHAIFKPPRLLGVEPRGVSISQHGAYVLYRWTDKDAEKPKRDLWIVSTASGESCKLFAADPKTGDTPRVWWTGRGAELLVLRDGWLEIHDPSGEATIRPLFNAGGGVSRVTFPDERHVVFSSGSDRELWVVDLETGERRSPAADLEKRSAWFQVIEKTRQIALFARAARDEQAADSAGDGAGDKAGEKAPEEPRVLHLVALEADGPEPRATGLSEGRSISVSPDARWAVGREIEPDREREIVVADYLTKTVSTRKARGTLAGDRVDRVSLRIHDLAGGKDFTPAIDDDEHFYLRGTHWSPDGERLLIRRLSDDMKVRELLVLEIESRRVFPIHVERDEAWIGGPFLWADWELGRASTVLFTSEKSGFNHLYRVSLDGDEWRSKALTSGEFEVQRVWMLEGWPRVLLRTNEPDPAEKHLALLDLRTRQLRSLPTAEGCVEDVEIAGDGAAIVYRQERLGDPGDLWALSLSRGEGPDEPVSSSPVRLTEFSRDALDALELTPPEIVEFCNPDDKTRVRALLYRPVPFDPAKKYPAIVFVHGAGYLQNVTKSMTRYDVNMLFHHRLARKGFFVFDPDYRHSAGYGRKFRTDIYGWMGGKDLDDVVAGAKYLVESHSVDATRIGIYGGSYGGFMTLMALFTKPDVFACGAALRSVTDWRSYSSWYTNPRLGTPEDEPENYVCSSPIDHAEKLTKPLLLLHGLVDTNVFAQDTIRLVEKLIQLEKDFELMIYPSQNHGFDDPESWIDEYRRIERFMERNLDG